MDVLDHKQAFSVWFSNHLSNTRPFDNQTKIYNLNTTLVRYSDGLCTFGVCNLVMAWLPDYLVCFWLPNNIHISHLLPLSLTNVVTFPHCFLTAYKRLWCLPILAGTSDSKNPDLYYSDVLCLNCTDNPYLLGFELKLRNFCLPASVYFSAWRNSWSSLDSISDS